jgi:hypothetical protein
MRNLDCNGASLGHTLQSQIISGNIVYIYLLSVNSSDREIIHQVKFEKYYQSMKQEMLKNRQIKQKTAITLNIAKS